MRASRRAVPRRRLIREIDGQDRGEARRREHRVEQDRDRSVGRGQVGRRDPEAGVDHEDHVDHERAEREREHRAHPVELRQPAGLGHGRGERTVARPLPEREPDQQEAEHELDDQDAGRGLRASIALATTRGGHGNGGDERDGAEPAGDERDRGARAGPGAEQDDHADDPHGVSAVRIPTSRR